MDNLNAAIEDLKTTIVEEGYTNTLVAEIAEDWDVHPNLLARKFAEKFNVSPAGYTKPNPVLLTNDFLMKQAHKQWHMNRLIGDPENGAVFGKRFKRKDREYLAVARIRGNVLLCIRSDNGEMRQISFPNSRSFDAGVRAWGLV